jgi:hypothetical protein
VRGGEGEGGGAEMDPVRWRCVRGGMGGRGHRQRQGQPTMCLRVCVTDFGRYAHLHERDRVSAVA